MSVCWGAEKGLSGFGVPGNFAAEYSPMERGQNVGASVWVQKWVQKVGSYMAT